MSTIKFECKIDHVAIVDPTFTQGKIIPVGEILEYEKTNKLIKATVKLRDAAPEGFPEEMYLKILEEVEKNPSCLRIAEMVSPPSNYLIVSTGRVILPKT